MLHHLILFSLLCSRQPQGHIPFFPVSNLWELPASNCLVNLWALKYSLACLPMEP